MALGTVRVTITVDLAPPAPTLRDVAARIVSPIQHQHDRLARTLEMGPENAERLLAMFERMAEPVAWPDWSQLGDSFAEAQRAGSLMEKITAEWGDEIAERAISHAERVVATTGCTLANALAGVQGQLQQGVPF